MSEAELDAMHMGRTPSASRPNPHDADLVDLLPDWLASDDLVRRVCVANPARLYGY